ncbi:hypothetical protein FZEAL_6962 [Fusarium zealandicum]|uniref:Uncharacterized protein n=1 Tax=Fusarium zealandicum TaxID=1053134 RepID=A0A8H4XI97_9HYPO|nr:hypothetical protein FZEAL_6962 [Fusarium zealandicum]
MSADRTGPLWAAKLNLRLLSISVCTVLLLIVFALAARSDHESNAVLLFGPLTGIAFAWSLLETVYLCTQKRRGSKPVIRIQLDSVFCIAFLASSSLIYIIYPVDRSESGLDEPRDGQSVSHRALFCFGVAEVWLSSIVRGLLVAIANEERKAQASEYRIHSPSDDPVLDPFSTLLSSRKAGPGIDILRDEEESLLVDVQHVNR